MESRRKKYAVLIGVITNAWSPYAPIIILFCCLLVTTCKLLIESRGGEINMKNRIKTVIWIALGLCICAGCFARQGGKYTREDLDGAKEQYYLTAYKYPAARFGEKELEENNTITLHEDTNIVKMTVAEESIKAFSIPEEFLTFYYEMSEEEMSFYRSFVE